MGRTRGMGEMGAMGGIGGIGGVWGIGELERIPDIGRIERIGVRRIRTMWYQKELMQVLYTLLSTLILHVYGCSN